MKGTFRCSYQKQVLTLVNQQRAKYGLPALTMTKALTDVAMLRAACEDARSLPNRKDTEE